MKKIKYNRQKTIEYANKWAFSRNPKYYNFDNIGGDCTSLYPNVYMQEVAQ